MTEEYRHIPVMLDEVLEALHPAPAEIVCDCTLGGAGHTLRLAQEVAPDGLMIGIDQDDMALATAEKRFQEACPDVEHLFLKGNFGDLDTLLVQAEVPHIDCFLFDLGVSSPQLDIAARGFSYREDAPLDMRMNPGKDTLTAAEVINTYNEADLTRIIKTYGDEKYASRIARSICSERADKAIETTFELVDVIKSSIPAAARRSGGHPARKTFQAIRIEVNHELEVLERGLRQAIKWLAPKGRICVIAYHSLEDKIVKHVFSDLSQGCICPPDLPVCVCGHMPIIHVETKKPLTAAADEVARNPRARSALMRVATRLDTSKSL